MEKVLKTFCYIISSTQAQASVQPNEYNLSRVWNKKATVNTYNSYQKTSEFELKQ